MNPEHAPKRLSITAKIAGAITIAIAARATVDTHNTDVSLAQSTPTPNVEVKHVEQVGYLPRPSIKFLLGVSGAGLLAASGLYLMLPPKKE